MDEHNDKLSAYIDGELLAEEAAHLEDALSKDKGLSARLARLRNADERMRRVFRAAAERPIPAGVLAMLLGQDAERDPEATGAVAGLPKAAVKKRWPAWPVAMAASIALAVCAATLSMLVLTAPNGRLAEQEFHIAALIAPDHPMFSILESKASAQQYRVDGAPGYAVKPLLSYQSASGEYCREFYAQDAHNAVHGVACRQAQHWNVKIAVRSSQTIMANGDYRAAASEGDQLIAEFVSGSMAGDAFGRAEELRLIENAWR